MKYCLPSQSQADTLLTDTVCPQHILFPGTTFLSVNISLYQMDRNPATHLERCSVWRLEIDCVPAPDSSADVDRFTIDSAPAIKTPPLAVHEVALLLPVKPLAGQTVVLVPPLGLHQGDVVQAVAVLRYEPGQLASGAGRPGRRTGAQLSTFNNLISSLLFYSNFT